MTNLWIPVETEIDVVIARLRGSELAKKLGLSASEVHSVAISISEVARNIIRYARRGELILTEAHAGRKRGLHIVAKDQGPGIVDLDRAMTPGFSTGNSLGLGLPSAKDQMDEFEIVSSPGQGTTITMIKWHKDGEPAGKFTPHGSNHGM